MKKTDHIKKDLSVLPVPTIRRLPLYLSFLKSIREKKIKHISAPEIARELHVDPTQIIKDISYINIKGRTKVGYETTSLIKSIEEFLSYNTLRKAVIAGIGNLGIALIKYNEFVNEGLEIIIGFDVDTEKTGMEINDIRIYNIKEFKNIVTKTSVDIGIITVPADQAQKVANTMIENGIKAIWNFSAIPLSAPNNIIVENTSIDSGLAMIKWKLKKNKPLIYKNRIL